MSFSASNRPGADVAQSFALGSDTREPRDCGHDAVIGMTGRFDRRREGIFLLCWRCGSSGASLRTWIAHDDAEWAWDAEEDAIY